VILGIEDHHQQRTLAHESIEKQLSVRALENRIKHLAAAKNAKAKKKHPQEVFIKHAAEELTQTWATKIEIKPKGKGGSLVFYFADETELDRLFENLKLGPRKA
jgi:ParB family chromosome partitioning protein